MKILIWDPVKFKLVPRVPVKTNFPSVVLQLYDPKEEEALDSNDQPNPEVAFKDVNERPVSWNFPTDKFGMIISPHRLDQNTSATLESCEFRPPSPAETEFKLHIVEEPLYIPTSDDLVRIFPTFCVPN